MSVKPDTIYFTDNQLEDILRLYLEISEIRASYLVQLVQISKLIVRGFKPFTNDKTKGRHTFSNIFPFYYLLIFLINYIITKYKYINI